MRPEEFWEALGGRAHWWLTDQHVKPKPAYMAFWLGLIMLTAALVIWQLRWRNQKGWKWTPGHGWLLVAIALAFFLGVEPVAWVAFNPRILLRILNAETLYDLSPYGVTLVIRTLRSLFYLQIMGLASVVLGVIALTLRDPAAPYRTGSP